MTDAANAPSDDVGDELNPRQLRFVAEYVVDLNATRAAIRAGYSPTSAHVQGSYLIRNPVVADAIAVELEARAKRVGISAERVLKELARLSFSDVVNVVDVVEHFDDEGNRHTRLELKDLKALPSRVTRTIESIRVKPTPSGPELTVKMHSKTTALAMLVKHLGLEAPVKSEVKVEAGDNFETKSNAELMALVTAMIDAKSKT